VLILVGTDVAARDSGAELSPPRSAAHSTPIIHHKTWMSYILKPPWAPRVMRVSVLRHIRLATSASKKTTFTETLEQGPSLDQFISGDVPERVVLGNTNTYVALLASR
jgi:hypothetical protein